MDDNINTLENADFTNRQYIKDMKDNLYDFTNDNDITIHNDKPTRHMTNTEPSCIDHITSNCPDNIYNLKTHLTTSSDHCSLTFTYSTKTDKYKPKD